MSKTMLALNAGSSSIKFGLFDLTGARPSYLFAGEISETGHKPRLTVKDMQGRSVLDRDWPAPRKQADILNDILEWTDQKTGSGGLAAVGHRIVHGGSQFVAPARLTSKTIDELARLTPMAPLHQEACLSPARTLLSLRPDLISSRMFRYGVPCGAGASGLPLRDTSQLRGERHPPLWLPWPELRIHCGKTAANLA